MRLLCLRLPSLQWRRRRQGSRSGRRLIVATKMSVHSGGTVLDQKDDLSGRVQQRTLCCRSTGGPLYPHTDTLSLSITAAAAAASIIRLCD